MSRSLGLACVLIGLAVLLCITRWGQATESLATNLQISELVKQQHGDLTNKYCKTVIDWARQQTRWAQSLPAHSRARQAQEFQQIAQVAAALTAGDDSLNASFSSASKYFVGMGISCVDGGELKSGESWLRLALQLEPADSQAWYRLGAILEADSRSESAAEAFEQAIAANRRWGIWPGQPYAAAQRAALLRFTTKEYEQAILDIEAAFADHRSMEAYSVDTWQWGWYIWGESLLRLNRWQEAATVFTRALSELSGDYELRSHFEQRLSELASRF